MADERRHARWEHARVPQGSGFGLSGQAKQVRGHPAGVEVTGSRLAGGGCKQPGAAAFEAGSIAAGEVGQEILRADDDHVSGAEGRGREVGKFRGAGKGGQLAPPGAEPTEHRSCFEAQQRQARLKSEGVDMVEYR